MTQKLTLRQLNRMYLDRQLLINRADMTISQATERVVGWQSQIPNPPYIGLWSRLASFQRDDLTRAMQNREIVRCAMFRSTLHLITQADHHRFHRVIEPALVKGLRSFHGRNIEGMAIPPLLTAIKPFLDESARSMGEIGKFLQTIEPERNPEALNYTIRTYLPLVQIPPAGTWGAGSKATYATAESWIGWGESADVGALFLRYLAGYGPASVMDFQTWTGMTKLASEIESVKGQLRVFVDENGVELYDLPDMPLPDIDAPLPVKFVPEYDNILIGHADRTRILPEEHRKKVFLTAGRVLNTILVDGFVAGVWKIETTKRTATLQITPFITLTDAQREALISEGERLTRFVADTAEQIAITFSQVD
ncbi:MAG: winged helix DNA-binding domain-containing protein [Anaerolineae bacterium]|jgi:hypothetical protein|nr:winged helix DNA-binding domain-containing protein [Anaerolineae bacterium]